MFGPFKVRNSFESWVQLFLPWSYSPSTIAPLHAFHTWLYMHISDTHPVASGPGVLTAGTNAASCNTLTFISGPPTKTLSAAVNVVGYPCCSSLPLPTPTLKRSGYPVNRVSLLKIPSWSCLEPHRCSVPRYGECSNHSATTLLLNIVSIWFYHTYWELGRDEMRKVCSRLCLAIYIISGTGFL